MKLITADLSPYFSVVRMQIYAIICIVSFNYSGIVIAQEFSAGKDPATKHHAIEEIVVTAQKRSENIRDVPVSMTVMSADFIRDAGIQDLRDISKFTPNLIIDPETKSAKMRGIGGANGLLTEPSVALVIDGIYYGRNTYLFMGLFEVAQVEILRGPQGLIIGKNASAGALTIRTRKPGMEPEFDASVEVGRFDHHKRNVGVTLPVVEEKVAVRLAYTDSSRNGMFYNTKLDTYDGGSSDETGRVAVLWDINDGVELLVNHGFTDRFQNEVLGQFTELSDRGRALHEPYDSEVEDDGADFQTSNDYPTIRAHQGDWTNAELNWEFEQFVLTAVAGWADSNDVIKIDGDMGPGAYATLDIFEYYKQQLEEVRLVSNPGKFEYTLGVFNFQSDVSAQQILGVGSIASTFNFDGVDLSSIFSGSDAEAVESIGTFAQNTKTTALFAQGKYQFTDSLSLSVGLRQTLEKKVTRLQRDIKPDGSEAAYTAALGSEEYDTTEMLEESDLAWSVSGLHELNDDISVYLTRSRGFKGGGYNSAAAKPEDFEYGPELSNTWEAGIKGRYFDGAMVANFGLYHTDFSDLQVLAQRDEGGASVLPGFIARNAGEARVRGVEADANIAPFDGMNIMLAVAYNDATFIKYADATCPESSEEEVCDLSGRPLPNAPLWKGSISPVYKLPFSFWGVGFAVRADAIYHDFEYQTLDLDPIDSREAFWQYNASFSIKGIAGRWSLDIQQMNVTDELIQTRHFDTPLGGGSHSATFEPPRRTVVKFALTF
jgi:iron complex outermembrane receptor protein